jgi:hypothetical protein
VITLKFAKDVAFMAAGAGMVVAYNKYNKPLKKKLEKTVNSAAKSMNNKLENMI